MNPTTDPAQPAPPAAAATQPLQPHRSSFTCDRHQHENFTGFCPSCLCERLTTLDQSAASAAPSSSRRPSTSSASAAIKSLFFKLPPSSNNNNATTAANRAKTTATSSFFPELRRTKSFSANSKNEGFSGAFEPQRKSCDVRTASRHTLWTLFSIDDESKGTVDPTYATHNPVLEINKEEEEEDDDEEEEADVISNNNDIANSDHDEDEIRVCQEVGDPLNVSNFQEVASEENVKTMKYHTDLDSQAKKPALSNFWSAASVFSKKWHKWRRKQKLKKSTQNDFNDAASMALPVVKKTHQISRQYRETQSEIADYGFGRRSCDTDPRFSLDAGRISFDDPRYSFDEPRASWDGYLIGRTFPRLPPMVEDVPVVHVARSDTLIPVEQQPDDSSILPGGSTQTREYYSDSSSKRRRSLDRSNSIRKTAAAVVAEIDELKGGVGDGVGPGGVSAVSNAKVSPATMEYIHAAKLLGGEREELIRDSNSNSLRDDCSETFELGFRDNGSVIGGGGEGGGERKGLKKSRRWSWKLWGFIHRRGGGSGNKDEEDERYSSRVNGVERLYSESWQDMRREGNGEGKNGLNRRVLRSNSSVSWRNSYNMGGSFGSVRKLNAEMNGNGSIGNGNGVGNGKKKKDEFVLERNRSARYSPNNHIDNGLLRFYLTPLRGSRRGEVGSVKSKHNNSHSIARSMLRLY